MRAWCRQAVLVVLVPIAGATSVDAAAIVDPALVNVAEFRWDTTADPSVSIFTLTNIWNGPQPGGTLVDNLLLLPSGARSFFDLEPGFPFLFDQLAEIGTPAFATTSVSFFYDSALVSLNATLTQPDTFAVLQFAPPQPVPEPGTLALLLAGGIVAAVRRLRRHS